MHFIVVYSFRPCFVTHFSILLIFKPTYGSSESHFKWVIGTQMNCAVVVQYAGFIFSICTNESESPVYVPTGPQQSLTLSPQQWNHFTAPGRVVSLTMQTVVTTECKYI